MLLCFTAVDPVPNEPRWQEPRRQHITCALDPSNPTENNSTLAVAFAVADINDVYECFVLQVRTSQKKWWKALLYSLLLEMMTFPRR